MSSPLIVNALRRHGPGEALVWRDEVVTFSQLNCRVEQWMLQVVSAGLRDQQVVLLEADFSPNAIALLLALIELRMIVVPCISNDEESRAERARVAQCQWHCRIGPDDQPHIVPLGDQPAHPLYDQLRQKQHPGLVLFSSGSTGKSKAAVHDLVPILERYAVPRAALRTAAFLLYDHIGGINTLLHTLFNGGCLVTLEQRSPDAVLRHVQRHRVQLLPTSPTFLNLVLISEAYRRYDLSSLQLVTYGTEPMPASTLRRIHQLLPHIRLLQTYGLSEVGILRSKSKSSDSLWVRVGGEGFETRVVDGVLEIKARSAMLGYLNAPSPFTPDGWLRTGDRVEVDGQYLRILGRESEIINVGGEKVYPAEVESVLQEMDGVESVVVEAVPNAILGAAVSATVRLNREESLPEFRRRMRAFCKGRMADFKVPQRVVLTRQELVSRRLKKLRHAS